MWVIERVGLNIPDLPSRLAEAQRRSGLNVTQFCNQVPITRSRWYKILRGDQPNIKRATLQRIRELSDYDFGLDNATGWISLGEPDEE
ncbi:MAG: hypothetical protein AAGF24_08155 [Cyanobacteria bacterium P01_H01_bin.121]